MVRVYVAGGGPHLSFWQRKTKQDGKPYHLYPTSSYRCCPNAAISIAMVSPDSHGLLRLWLGCCLILPVYYIYRHCQQRTLEKSRKLFLLRSCLNSEKLPAVFLPTPYRRGYRLSRKSSRLRRLGLGWGALLFFNLCISRASCTACIRLILIVSPK